MPQLLVFSVLLLLASLSVSLNRASPSGGRITSLLHQLGPSPSVGVLPSVGRSIQAKTQRRALTLGSRLEPIPGVPMSPGVKAMRYGRRSQHAMSSF